jgi:hypothetical protein
MSTMSVVTKGLSAGSLYKILFIGNVFSLGPVIVIMGILSLFDLSHIQFGETTLTGIYGFLASLILAIIIPLISALTNWVILGFGLWVYHRFGHLKITYKTNKGSSNLS